MDKWIATACMSIEEIINRDQLLYIFGDLIQTQEILSRRT